MFRSILSEGRKAFALANLKSYYSSKPRTFPEINQVTLAGTLISDAFTLPSGIKCLTVRTVDAATERYQHNHVHTKGFENLKAGQRVHVTGTLRSLPIELENEKRREQTSVIANRVFVLEDQSESENSVAKDINQIDIAGNVSYVAKVLDGIHLFKLATHFEKNTEDGLIKGTLFHTVYVYDEHLKKLSENLQVRDRVAIHGEIRSATNTQSDGKKKFTGYIKATWIEKLKRREQQVDHDDVEHEANN